MGEGGFFFDKIVSKKKVGVKSCWGCCPADVFVLVLLLFFFFFSEEKKISPPPHIFLRLVVN